MAKSYKYKGALAKRRDPLTLVPENTEIETAFRIIYEAKTEALIHELFADCNAGPFNAGLDMRPGIDASSWPYCAQATVTLAHPKNKDDTPMVEIYFEKPEHGHPGAAYAFRGVLVTRDGDPDYIRFRKDFEAEWNERFAPGSSSPRCKDE